MSDAGPKRLFGVSQFTTKSWSFEEDLERLPRLGVDAIEITEEKLDQDRYAEQIAELRRTELAISGLQPQVRTFFASRMVPMPRTVDARASALRGSIERLGPLLPGVPFMVNTGAHPRGDMAEAVARTAAELAALAPVAEDHGVTLALEPLNPTSMNIESMIWTVDQALEIIDRVDRPSVGLCLDLWNVWQAPDLLASIRRAGARILTVQFGDWRPPRSFADRVVPGDGVIPLAELIGAVETADYRGAFVLELFSDDVPNTLYNRLEPSIVRGRQALNAIAIPSG